MRPEEPERGAAFLWIGTPGEAMLGLWSLGSAPVGLSLHIPFTALLDDVLGACERLRSLDVAPLSFFATRRHAASNVRGSTVRRPLLLLNRDCSRSSIDSRR